jgi:hypothetical protein
MQFLESLTYLLLLSIYPACGVWFGSGIWLMQRKRRLMSSEERAQIRSGRDMNVAFRAAFLYSDAMRADPLIRRLRAVRLVCFFWPFLMVGFAGVVFNFILPQPVGPN